MEFVQPVQWTLDNVQCNNIESVCYNEICMHHIKTIDASLKINKTAICSLDPLQIIVM